jgi:geranylgeranyl diphosphate synthase type II
MGLSFQLMDDYLDSFGEKAKVGKKIGGDILNKKKTFLWNEMWTNLNQEEIDSINHVFETSNDDEIIEFIKRKMQSTKADKKTLHLAEQYTTNSHSILDHLSKIGNTEYLEEILTLLSKREN